ncbi:M20/M25/M40 family metallo-hydrolase [Streptomyces albulus]|nr:M20/M25/M40 family metallo-hydrolase [Streptomyces noursei]MCZ1018785.1 M20/M25/M40 family metallo-hydrolase [Streptomyces noursei]GGX21703.1 dipeptidase [Streptomyces noursei]
MPHGAHASGAASALETTVDGLMDDLCADLERLAAIPSIAFPGFSPEPVLQARDLVVELLRAAGVTDIGELNLPHTAPVVTATIPPPTPDAPTVLLYAHYDVQPAADEHLWDSPPFEPTRIEGGIRARGIADDKVNLMVHLGALRAWRGRPPVGIKIVFEGQEEYGSAFDGYPPTDPTAFACDAMIIADTGNIRPGTPTLTTALRGSVDVFVDVRTLDSAVHSGQYGGAAPDALLVLVKALATLHDLHGDVAVEGLRREPWHGTALAEDDFRALAGVPDGTPLLGSGGLGERLWSGPALTVVGLDAPSADRGAAAVVPHARAKLNLRVHPRQDPQEAQDALVRHLRRLRPFGIPLTVTPGDTGPGYEAGTDGPAYRAARTALRRAWGAEPVDAAAGGSVPLVNGLATAVPQAEILLFGAADSLCRMHAPNERMLRSEFRGALLAEALFFAEYAAAHRPGGAA